MHPTIGFGPLAVEVESCEVGAEVAIDDSVGVDHGYRDDFVVFE